MLSKTHNLYDSKFLAKDQVQTWVREGPNLELVKEAEGFGRYISKELKEAEVEAKGKIQKRDESVTTSQIRQVFTKIKSIEAKGGLAVKGKDDKHANEKNIIEFLMIKPLMAYAAGRHNVTGLDRLKERLEWAIDAVLSGGSVQERQHRFENFCKLFEAILAYHKACGGK